MADVLIVCVREDELQAKALADMFERAGFSVGGAPGSDGALRSTGAGVIVWSQASIRSRPFLDAAQRVIDADKAVIASLIDPPPAHTINNAQAFALEGWTGDPEDAALDPLFFAVDRMVTSQRASVGDAPARPAPGEFEEPPSLRPPPAYNRPRSEPPQRAAPPARGENLGAEAEHWRAIRDSKDPADFMDYLARYGVTGAFSEVAEIKLKQLTGPKAPAAPPPASLRDAAKNAAPKERARRLDLPPPPPPRPEPPRRVEPPPAPRMAEPPPRRVEPPPPRREVREPLPAAAYRRDYEPPPPHVRDNSARNGGMMRLLVLALLLGGGAFGANYFLNNNSAPAEQVAENSEPPPADVASNEPLPQGDGMGGADVANEPVQLDRGPTSERAAPVRAQPNRQQQQQQQRPPQQRPTQTAATEVEDGPPPAPRTSWANEPATTSGGPASILPGATQQPAQPAPQIFAANNPPPAAPVAAPRPAGTIVFAQRPSARRIADLYPARAQRDGTGGRVQLDCVVRGDLALSCAVGSESPAGMGFGQAALAASSGYRSQASLSNGDVAAGSRARIVIVFQPPAD